MVNIKAICEYNALGMWRQPELESRDLCCVLTLWQAGKSQVDIINSMEYTAYWSSIQVTVITCLSHSLCVGFLQKSGFGLVGSSTYITFLCDGLG